MSLLLAIYEEHRQRTGHDFASRADACVGSCEVCNALFAAKRREDEAATFVLLSCWYEGDGNLVDDSFVACGDLEALKRFVPAGAELFMPGETVPDNGKYGDSRRRFRIAAVPLLQIPYGDGQTHGTGRAGFWYCQRRR